MRYIGNKAKLVPFILRTLDGLGLKGGEACDPFAGTASVARALKRAGWRVHSGDVMAFSYALQVARVELDAPPRFPGGFADAASQVRNGPTRADSALDGGAESPGGTRGAADSVGGDGYAPYAVVLSGLSALPGEHGFITEHFTPAGTAGARHGRMYFTPDNAGRIDAIRKRIAETRRRGAIDSGREQLLIATLVEAADRVANTTGVYASFVKSWQSNAVRPLELRPLVPTAPGEHAAPADAPAARPTEPSATAPATAPAAPAAHAKEAEVAASPNERGTCHGPCTAFHGTAEECVRRAGPVDLLYLDPPYNERQYPAYYHIPELIAAGWDPPPRLRGKTGLIPDDDLRSEWCRRDRVEDALRGILDAADTRHVLLSYNDEGLLPAERIEQIFRDRGVADSYRRFGRGYKRYRSDADGPERTYARDRVREVLHYVRLA